VHQEKQKRREREKKAGENKSGTIMTIGGCMHRKQVTYDARQISPHAQKEKTTASDGETTVAIFFPAVCTTS
jgi:hypothetical protein